MASKYLLISKSASDNGVSIRKQEFINIAYKFT